MRALPHGCVYVSILDMYVVSGLHRPLPSQLKPLSHHSGLPTRNDTEQSLLKSIKVSFIWLLFSVYVPCPLMLGKSVRNLITCTKPVTDRTGLSSRILLRFESVLSIPVRCVRYMSVWFSDLTGLGEPIKVW